MARANAQGPDTLLQTDRDQLAKIHLQIGGGPYIRYTQRLRLPKTSSVEESWRFSMQMRRKSLSFTGREVLRRHSLAITGENQTGPPRMAEIWLGRQFEGFHSPESVQHPAFYRYQESYPRRNGSPRNCCSRAGDERNAIPVSV